MSIHSGDIFVAVDGSPVTPQLCEYAAWLFNSINQPVHLLHSVERSFAPAVADLSGQIGLGASEDLLNELASVEQKRSQLLLQRAAKILQHCKTLMQNAGVKHVELHSRHGDLAESLIDFEDQIRVLILGIKGEDHAEEEAGVGHQLEKVIRALHRPILIVNDEFKTPENIMLAYDGGEASKKALQMVIESPALNSRYCHLVAVGESKEAVINDASEMLKSSGIEYRAKILKGELLQSLIDYQEQHQIDLTVMGAFGHSKIRDFLVGSFTAKMIATTRKPLLLLR